MRFPKRPLPDRKDSGESMEVEAEALAHVHSKQLHNSYRMQLQVSPFHYNVDTTIHSLQMGRQGALECHIVGRISCQ